MRANREPPLWDGRSDIHAAMGEGGFIIEAARCQGVPLMLVGDARVADRGGPGALPAACPGSTTTSCTLHFDLPPLVAVRADRFRMLESVAVTRLI